jgi:protein-arginine kinase activator protein McsA
MALIRQQERERLEEAARLRDEVSQLQALLRSKQLQ